MKNMTSKKNMSSNRKPRRIHRNKGGRKKGIISSMMKKYYPIKNEEDYNRIKKLYKDPMDKSR